MVQFRDHPVHYALTARGIELRELPFNLGQHGNLPRQKKKAPGRLWRHNEDQADYVHLIAV